MPHILKFIGNGVNIVVTLAWVAFTWWFLYIETIRYTIRPAGQWNILSDIGKTPEERIPIYIHIVGNSIILVFGPFQILNFWKRSTIHRVTGIIYMNGCIITAMAGLSFLILNGSVGGAPMTVAFATNGVLLFAVSMATAFAALRRDTTFHIDMAQRLFWLGSSSVFYRVLYLLDFAIHGVYSPTWVNTTDYAFDWLFFVIPMLIAELSIGLRKLCTRDFTVMPEYKQLYA